MISYWGGHEIIQRRRMRILQEVSNQLNQRLGYDHAIKINLERLLNFYSAKICILVIKRPNTQPQYRSYMVSNGLYGGEADDSGLPDSDTQNSLTEDSSKLLLDLPENFATHYKSQPTLLQRLFKDSHHFGNDPAIDNQLKMLANLLDTGNFLTTPYIQHDGTHGCLYLIPQKQNFLKSDVDFVRQLLKSISNVVENIQLIDERVSSSAKHERFKISLDIHDTTIQPYIGLKLGLDALKRQATANNPLREGINELLDMTESTISDLRRYVTTLREDKSLEKDTLVSSITDQAEHFKRCYGIDVKVNCSEDIRLNSRLACSVMQIFSEGLSNILRHTQTKHAYITVNCENENLQLQIANEVTPESSSQSEFLPRSINARALSLGGSSFVKTDANGYTIVNINIPL
jgi:signal transduction histidine kinase